MIIIEQISDTHIRVYRDGRIIYDSYDEEVTRHYTPTDSFMLDGPRQRGLELKEAAELFY